MRSLFIDASGFVALNDRQDKNHPAALEFVTSLFNETVKVYTSVIEITWATDELSQRVDQEKVFRFLDFFKNGGITVVGGADGDSMRVARRLYKRMANTNKSLSYRQALMLVVLRELKIKDVFSFEPNLKSFSLMYWPR